MARVRAKELFFDNVVLRVPGEEFDFDGAPGEAIEFLNPKEEAAAEAARAKVVAERTRADIVNSVRAEEIAKIRAEVISEERERIRAQVREQVRAELKAAGKAAGKDDASELV